MIDSLIRWSIHNRPSCCSRGGVPDLGRVQHLEDARRRTAGSQRADRNDSRRGPGMVPTEMESLVTFPIESALNGAAGVRRVRSATAVGVAVIWVEFDWGQDIQRARQTVTEKLNTVSGSLPPRSRDTVSGAGLVHHGRDPVHLARVVRSTRHGIANGC